MEKDFHKGGKGAPGKGKGVVPLDPASIMQQMMKNAMMGNVVAPPMLNPAMGLPVLPSMMNNAMGLHVLPPMFPTLGGPVVIPHVPFAPVVGAAPVSTVTDVGDGRSKSISRSASSDSPRERRANSRGRSSSLKVGGKARRESSRAHPSHEDSFPHGSDGSATEAEFKTWICADDKCGTKNHVKRRNCSKCRKEAPPDAEVDFISGSKIFKEGDWRCSSCGNVNWEWRTNCNKCTLLLFLVGPS